MNTGLRNEKHKTDNPALLLVLLVLILFSLHLIYSAATGK